MNFRAESAEIARRRDDAILAAQAQARADQIELRAQRDREIHGLFAEGMIRADVARTVGCSLGTVAAIRSARYRRAGVSADRKLRAV